MKRGQCVKYSCDNPPHLGGLCRKHYDERHIKEQENDNALDTLNTLLINGKRIEKDGLYQELKAVRVWWQKASYAIQHDFKDDILKDELEYVPGWCLEIVKAIIKEEEAYKSGSQADLALSDLKFDLWECFKNLELGLMSNGLERSND